MLEIDDIINNINDICKINGCLNKKDADELVILGNECLYRIKVFGFSNNKTLIIFNKDKQILNQIFNLKTITTLQLGQLSLYVKNYIESNICISRVFEIKGSD